MGLEDGYAGELGRDQKTNNLFVGFIEVQFCDISDQVRTLGTDARPTSA